MNAACRSLAVTLALAAMLVRALLPMGWMPAPAPDGGAVLVVCTMDGLHHLPAGHPPAKGAADDRGYVCPFAAAAHLAPPLVSAVVVPPATIARPEPVVPAFARFASAVSQAHPARGPPASV